MNQKIENFITASRQATNIDELFLIYKQAMSDQGYDQIIYAVLSDHQHLSNYNELGVVLQSNLDSWIKHYSEKNYKEIDPAAIFTSANSGFFTWDFIAQQEDLTRKQLDIFKDAENFGLYKGINVAIAGPGGVKCVVLSASSQKNIKLAPNAWDLINLISYQFNTCFLDLSNHNPLKKENILTRREQEILKWLGTGLTKSQVGNKVHLSQHTVNFHMRSILNKLDANNTSQALVTAIKEKLINI